GACYVARGADCNQCNSSGNIVPKPDGTTCDDKDPCTPTSSCQGGSCTGTPPAGTEECASATGPQLAYAWGQSTNVVSGSFTAIVPSEFKPEGQVCYDVHS